MLLSIKGVRLILIKASYLSYRQLLSRHILVHLPIYLFFLVVASCGMCWFFQAIQTIDGEIAQQLSIRRKHREGVGPAYFDSGVYAQGHAGVLPEALRPKPGRLSHSQQRVYEVPLY